MSQEGACGPGRRFSRQAWESDPESVRVLGLGGGWRGRWIL